MLKIPEKIIKEPEVNKKDLEKFLFEAEIDYNKKYERPPVILSLIENYKNTIIEKKIFTFGNFSCIKGKAKSKKTFLLSLFVTPLITNNIFYDKIKAFLPENKKLILWFDTEQGEYDSYIVLKRVIKLAKIHSENFKYFNLRRFSPIERCEIIEFSLNFYKNVGVVIIDGITDLANAINDEIEATRVCSLLLRLTKDYNIHISTIIHENKNDNFATGHLGSSIMKKAEVLISVKNVDYNTCVSCDMIRGTEHFRDFYFEIDNESKLPIIIDFEKADKKADKRAVNNYYEVEKEEALPF